MRLEAVSAVLRPRQPWEAVDLGVALLRENLGPVYRAWAAVVVPVFLLLHLACVAVPWLVPLLLWWLKPLLDRVVLYVLSRSLFGERVTVRQVWRALPGEWWRDGLAALTLRRFSPARSFRLPVSQLERLRGRARRERLRLLGRRDGATAVGLTLICLNLEFALSLGLMALGAMLLPGFVLENALEALLAAPHLQLFLLSLAGLGAMTLMEPVYVACGFALYLNRRTWLEAWDLEIGFRQLAGRLAPLTLALALWLPGAPVRAQSEPPEVAVSAECRAWRQTREDLARAEGRVKSTLARVLEEPDFQRCRELGGWTLDWDWEPAQEVERPAWTRPLAVILEWLLWLLVGAGVVILVVWLSRQQRPAAVHRRAAARGASLVLRGETVHAGELDPGAPDAAWRLWQAGQPREALSLLYRASLAALLARGVRLGLASTEDECLAHAAGQLPDHAHGYLARLTRAWQALAYGHRPPDAATMEALCREWRARLLAPPEAADAPEAGA